MAGTIIDSLVIELGLDAAKMSKGAQKSVSELRRMENTAEQTGKRVSESGTRAAEFFTKMSAAALGFFGVITAGRGLKVRWSRPFGQFCGLDKLYPVVVMPPF